MSVIWVMPFRAADKRICIALHSVAYEGGGLTPVCFCAFEGLKGNLRCVGDTPDSADKGQMTCFSPKRSF